MDINDEIIKILNSAVKEMKTDSWSLKLNINIQDVIDNIEQEFIFNNLHSYELSNYFLEKQIKNKYKIYAFAALGDLFIPYICYVIHDLENDFLKLKEFRHEKDYKIDDYANSLLTEHIVKRKV